MWANSENRNTTQALQEKWTYAKPIRRARMLLKDGFRRWGEDIPSDDLAMSFRKARRTQTVGEVDCHRELSRVTVQLLESREDKLNSAVFAQSRRLANKKSSRLIFYCFDNNCRVRLSGALLFAYVPMLGRVISQRTWLIRDRVFAQERVFWSRGIRSNIGFIVVIYSCLKWHGEVFI